MNSELYTDVVQCVLIHGACTFLLGLQHLRMSLVWHAYYRKGESSWRLYDVHAHVRTQALAYHSSLHNDMQDDVPFVSDIRDVHCRPRHGKDIHKKGRGSHDDLRVKEVQSRKEATDESRQMVHHSVESRNSLCHCCENHRVDEVMHLALDSGSEKQLREACDHLNAALHGGPGGEKSDTQKQNVGGVRLKQYHSHDRSVHISNVAAIHILLLQNAHDTVVEHQRHPKVFHFALARQLCAAGSVVVDHL
mmetsp:Transcript_10416/g.38675  ORF Transcript_10416/g.38675 Transcript_10416/m.38675 type:complete len:249 (+) Transcript_10416:2956-3702(+)